MVTYREYSTDHGLYSLSLLQINLGWEQSPKLKGALFRVLPPSRNGLSFQGGSFHCYFRFRGGWQDAKRGTFELTSINWCGAIPKKSHMMPNPQPDGWRKDIVRDQGMLLLAANYPDMDYAPGTMCQLPKLLEKRKDSVGNLL